MNSFTSIIDMVLNHDYITQDLRFKDKKNSRFRFQTSKKLVEFHNKRENKQICFPLRHF